MRPVKRACGLRLARTLAQDLDALPDQCGVFGLGVGVDHGKQVLIARFLDLLRESWPSMVAAGVSRRGE